MTGASQTALRLLLRRRSKLQVAPLRLRFLASLINGLLAVALIAFAVGGGTGLYFIARRSPLKGPRGTLAEWEPPLTVRRSDRDEFRQRESPFVAKMDVRLNRRRSPGARAVGIRLVDARTGGEPARWQALVHAGTRGAWRYATEHLIPWPKLRSPCEDETFRSAVEDARRRHADDPDALQIALMRVYKEHRVSPMAISCLPVYLRLLLTFAIEAPALWTPLKQGLPDKLARTVVIVERRPPRRPPLLARIL